MLKSTTRERFKKWSETAGSSDEFTWEGKGYTKKEFEKLHNLKGSKPKHKDIEEKVNEELERREDPEHIEQSGDGTGEG